jgi:hypothetical protein
MTELENLINKNQGKKSNLIIGYYNFLKSIKEFQNEKIVQFIIGKSFIHDDCFVLTDSRVLVLENHYSKGLIVKINVNLMDIENVMYKEETLFSGRKLVIKLNNTIEVDFASFDKEELKSFERIIIFCLGSIASIEDKKGKEELTLISTEENHSEKSDNKIDDKDDIITKKLQKLKKLFEEDLISKY